MEDLIVIVILICVGYFFGLLAEKRHYTDIRKREGQTLNLPIASFGAKTPIPDAADCQLFVGTVVISSDYFKTFVMVLRNLIGGRVIVYESLLDRGRREALLRVKEQAIAWGATEVLNVRYETASIGSGASGRNGPVSIEVIAYGTGIR